MGFIYETQQVVIQQPYVPKGSLKDLIYGVINAGRSPVASHIKVKPTMKAYGSTVLKERTLLSLN